MDFKQAMAKLEGYGTAQNRKTYARHGVSGPMFGVSFAHLKQMAKETKTDHDLAQELWASGNHDARILATMIADPKKATAKLLDAWVRDLDNYVLTGALANLASRAPSAVGRYKKWIGMRGERVSAAGWTVFSHLCDVDDAISDETCRDALITIEGKIHEMPNRTRHSMNQAVIAIGIRGSALEKEALATAGRIGKVHVDHGETSCKTPDAAEYIKKTLAHRRSKA